MILDQLEALYAEQEDTIEAWFSRERKEAAPFAYSSVDLRHSGARLVPVDTNLFPAGFNNLSPRGEARATRFFASMLEERFPDANRILIVPENHTRNLFYLDNLAALTRIVEGTGKEVRIGSLIAEAGNPLALTSQSGHSVMEYPLIRDGATLALEDGFTPDAVLLNNDCTTGIPSLLEGITQPIMPPPELGWWRRRKSVHFLAYENLARNFCAEFGLDPWLVDAYYHRCGRIDFKEHAGVDALARAVDSVLEKARRKHKQYGIEDDPYVFVKADSGTYGMGIMTLHSGSEILELNKKERNKMSVIKEGAQVSEVIVQEGVASIDTVQGAPAEPMIYLVDGIPVGGMYRVNDTRDNKGNLNASGMRFAGMCDEGEPVDCDRQPVRDCHFRALGLIGALAALACPRELYGEDASLTTAAL